MNNSSILTEAAVLTQVNKWVGVIIALIGAFIAAPDGARLIFRSSATWIRTQINRFRKPPRAEHPARHGRREQLGRKTDGHKV
jgi:hypothetical protein